MTRYSQRHHEQIASKASQPSTNRNRHSRVTFSRRVKTYLAHHKQSMIQSLKQLAQTPIASIITLMVIGIALALPFGLYTILGKLHTVTQGWDTTAQISVFFNPDIPVANAQLTADKLNDDKRVQAVKIIPAQTAWQDLQASMGLVDGNQILPNNPLPTTLIITPRSTLGAQSLEALANELKQIQGVEIAQQDIAWVKRLDAIIELARRATVLLAALLGGAVLFIIGNTIRMTITQHQHEMAVVKLMGATDGYVRRPFLYTGVWFGMGGSLIACLIIGISGYWLAPALLQLFTLYGANSLEAPAAILDMLALLGIGMLLGLIGAWFAANRQLRELRSEG